VVYFQGMSKAPHSNITLPKLILDRLKPIAELADKSVSALVRECIRAKYPDVFKKAAKS